MLVPAAVVIAALPLVSVTEEWSRSESDDLPKLYTVAALLALGLSFRLGFVLEKWEDGEDAKIWHAAVYGFLILALNFVLSLSSHVAIGMFLER